MLKFLRNKIADIAIQYNRIDPLAKLHPTVYCSGVSIIGEVSIDEGAKVFQSYVEGRVNVGRFTSLWGPGVYINGKKDGVKIGNFSSVARYVSIQGDYHNMARTTTYFLERNLLGEEPAENAIVSKGQILIGHDVWIGTGAQILSGVSVGNGAVIAAGAIVTKDVTPYAIVVGNPARTIKYRFEPDTIDTLLDSEWWNWSIDKIKENKDFLLTLRE
jgi:virginiamycin A acetyltransferase